MKVRITVPLRLESQNDTVDLPDDLSNETIDQIVGEIVARGLVTYYWEKIGD